MIAHIDQIAPLKGQRTPEQVLESIVDGINTGNLDSLMPLYEPGAAFAAQPGTLADTFGPAARLTASRAR